MQHPQPEDVCLESPPQPPSFHPHVHDFQQWEMGTDYHADPRYPQLADQSIHASASRSKVPCSCTLFTAFLLNDFGKVGSACQSLPARFLVENKFGLRDADRRDEALIVRYLRGAVGVMEDERWINGSGTRCTRETGDGREPHGGVKRLAVAVLADCIARQTPRNRDVKR
jgi:hypothetical protein